MHIHTVKTGETVYTVAAKYGVSPTKILENNMMPIKSELSFIFTQICPQWMR